MNRAWTVVFLLLLGGCAERLSMDTDMRMDGSMELKGTMDMSAGLRLEGPVTIEMRGPTVEYTGIFISEELLDRVDVGETRVDWVLAVLGEPTGRGQLGDGSEIWQWSYRPVAQTASLVSILKLQDDEPKPVHSTTFLHLRAGLVVDKWRG